MLGPLLRSSALWLWLELHTPVRRELCSGWKCPSATYALVGAAVELRCPCPSCSHGWGCPGDVVHALVVAGVVHARASRGCVRVCPCCIHPGVLLSVLTLTLLPIPALTVTMGIFFSFSSSTFYRLLSLSLMIDHRSARFRSFLGHCLTPTHPEPSTTRCPFHCLPWLARLEYIRTGYTRRSVASPPCTFHA